MAPPRLLDPVHAQEVKLTLQREDVMLADVKEKMFPLFPVLVLFSNLQFETVLVAEDVGV